MKNDKAFSFVAIIKTGSFEVGELA